MVLVFGIVFVVFCCCVCLSVLGWIVICGGCGVLFEALFVFAAAIYICAFFFKAGCTL